MKKSGLLFSVLCTLTIFAQQKQPVQPTKNTAPKLVVGIVVDQMRYDYIYRFWDKYQQGGFRRLVNEGFFCKNTNYNYVPTYTGPGHASIFTGTTPLIHGIIANDWYNRKTGTTIYCAEDKSQSTVGSTTKAGQMSPRNMLSTSVCDQLKLHTNKKSKVIGIALKDRGAIMPAGHMADAAYWFDLDAGNWITSSYYRSELPKWTQTFNENKVYEKYLNKPWTTLLPIEQYTESAADDNLYEGSLKSGVKPVFPYDLPALYKDKGVKIIRTTPFGNSLTKDFAIEAIKAEQLGKSTNTDFLTLSFSSTDYIGHTFGPQSIELEDCYLRLDRDIAEFLKFIDMWVGKQNALIFLTADHGAVDVPAYLIDNKIPAGYFDDKAFAKQVTSALLQKFGDTLLLEYINQQVYLDNAKIKAKNIDIEKVYETIASIAYSMDGVASVITAKTILTTSFTDGITKKIQNGFNAQRSGDMIITFNPGWTEYQHTGTTHGSAYNYDTHVPLIWYGGAIKSGSTNEAVNITDIAPTLSNILNIPYPNGCTGKVITGVIK
ncbi:MAG: alkaline phosphatase family protein [Bacteroidetes bacterium]|nr:alkaline phosphatase family protein [Bacteroidota bacterium]